MANTCLACDAPTPDGVFVCDNPACNTAIEVYAKARNLPTPILTTLIRDLGNHLRIREQHTPRRQPQKESNVTP